MTVSAEALRQLHRLHRQNADIRERLERGPKQVAARQTQLKHVEATLEQTKESRTKTLMAIKEKELTLAGREQRILDIKAKLNSCSSNREYQTFVEQIAADEQANSVLSDEILELFDAAEAHEKAVKESEQAVSDARSHVEQLKQKVADERAGLEADIVRLADELRESESALPTEIRQEYDRVVKAHADDALAPLADDEVCGGCYQRITPQMINELRLEQMVFCKSCGRLLYIPEDTAVS